jgi:hypothetical protein
VKKFDVKVLSYVHALTKVDKIRKKTCIGTKFLLFIKKRIFKFVKKRKKNNIAKTVTKMSLVQKKKIPTVYHLKFT